MKIGHRLFRVFAIEMSTNRLFLFLLLFLESFIYTAAEFFPSQISRALDRGEFQFTAPEYNLSIYENVEIGALAINDNCGDGRLQRIRKLLSKLPKDVDDQTNNEDKNASIIYNSCAFGAVKIGAYLPRGYNQISFKIVDGDHNQRFNATTKKLGNFAFLLIEFRHDDILNREMQSEYRLLVKAVAKRRKANALEASAVVNLRVLDENDNSPMFRRVDYELEADDYTPINSRLIQLDGFDADDGLNGALWYSISNVTDSNAQIPLYVESHSGWIRNYAPLLPGTYTIECRIEDRASRLYHNDDSKSSSNVASFASSFIRNRAIVKILITPRRNNDTPKPKIYISALELEPYCNGVQAAAVLRVEDAISKMHQLELRVENIDQAPNYLRLERTSADEFLLTVANTSTDIVMFNVSVIEHLSFRNTQSRQVVIHTENFAIMPNNSRRTLSFDFNIMNGIEIADSNEKLIRITVAESTFVGEIIEQFSAKSFYQQDQHKIRYKMQAIPSENHSRTSVQIHGGFVVEPFDLNWRKGQLRLKTALDYDDPTQQRTYIYRLIALIERDIKDDAPIASVETRLIIELTDSNDNCPKFISESVPHDFRVQVTSGKHSNTPSDLVILQPKVKDADSGSNAKIVYKLLGVNGSENYFRINALSGEIRITNDLPLNENAWLLRVLVMDLGLPISQFTQFTIEVQRVNVSGTLTDVLGIVDSCTLPNQFPPVIKTESRKIFDISEDAKIGEKIGVIVARDLDVAYNGWLRYSLDDIFFRIDSMSGEIFVRTNLTSLVQAAKPKIDANNVEYIDHAVEVIVRDSPIRFSESKSAKSIFIIRITGANIHTPKFEKISYSIIVNEDQSEIELLQLRAHDADIGKNGRIKYDIAMVDVDEFFTINPISGILRLKKPLGREYFDMQREGILKRLPRFADEIQLLVMAYDNGMPPNIAFANVTIHVKDVNDNAPYCLRDVHRANLFEDSPNNSLVLCIAAEDADVGDNAKLEFELTYNDGKPTKTVPFRIDRESGCIFLKTETSLDFEKVPVYKFNVTVWDKGQPVRLNTNCAVEISLINVDRNNFPPKFSDVAFEASVEENLPEKTEVLRVGAIDPENAVVIYHIVGGSGLGLFEIDEFSGMIRTTRELDFEQGSYYWLTVCATDVPKDSLSTSLSSHIHILVRVLNRNDRAPVFTQPIFFAKITENSAENRVVQKVEAVDPDYNGIKLDGSSSKAEQSNKGVKYSIMSGNPQSNFAIDENTGYIVTGRRRLDYETQSEHELVVKSCDFGVPSLCTTALVVVSVEDVNDCAPNFGADTLTIPVPAERPVGSFLGRVFATDADGEGRNSELDYRLEAKGVNERFKIDRFGRLFSREPLKAGTQHQLRIVARDAGIPPLEGNATVTLIVTGRANKFTVSNRKPRLIAYDTWRELYVSDSDVVGTVVGKVNAVDDDGDPLWWEIHDHISNPNCSFAFRGSDGELILARRVSAMDVELSEIRLHFTVSDGVDYTEDTINIRISRSLNERPQFLASNESIILKEGTLAGYVVYTVHAQMNGLTQNEARIVYGIHSVDDISAGNVLRIDSRSGNIFLQNTLNVNRIFPNFTVVISASANGRINFARLEFRIQLSNKHSPVFLFNDYEFFIDENIENTKSNETYIYVGHVEVFDVDSNGSDHISYEIISGNVNGEFLINAKTGDLFVKSGRRRSRYFTKLTIRASDNTAKMQHMRSTTTAVRIYDLSVWSIGLNNNPIVIETEHFHSLIDDTTPVGSVLTLFNVKEADGFVTFSLGENNNKKSYCDERFDLDFANGVLRLRNLWPADKISLINCTVTAIPVFEDNFNATEIAIHYKILPKSWNDLRFAHNEYVGIIEENTPALRSLLFNTQNRNTNAKALYLPTTIGTFAVSSKGKTIKYQILNDGGNGDAHFTIDNSMSSSSSKVNGSTEIVSFRTTSNAFDFEKTKTWRFYVTAVQMGDRFPFSRHITQPIPINVIVKDVNDETPYFPYSHESLLHLPPVNGAILCSVVGNDADTIGRLRYAIRQVEEERNNKRVSVSHRLFHVNSNTGIITVASDDPSKYSASDYWLKVIASDGLHTNSTIVHILAKNATNKENSLKFSRELYSISVRENQTISTAPASIEPLLSLWPMSSNIVGKAFEFRIVNPHPSFSLDSQTGLLYLNYSTTLDRENTPKLRLSIRAQSIEALGYETDENTAYTIVNVDVEDVNDCAPQFTQHHYTANIADDAGENTRVVVVKATDADLGMNGVVRYRLAENAPSFFDINKYDGRITIAHRPQIPMQLGAEFRFYVIAADRGNPPMESKAEVRLRVTNRYQPIFTHSHYTARVSEAAAIGTHVISVRAFSNTNGMVGYAIHSGDVFRHFNIDFTKGEISLRALLDARYISKYSLAVIAFDVTRNMNDTISSALVTIYVDPARDVPPQFERIEYSMNVKEIAPIGTLIGTVRALLTINISGISKMNDNSDEYKEHDRNHTVIADKEIADIFEDNLKNEILYAIVDGNKSVISLDASTGQIFLSLQVDFEERNYYEYTISARNVNGLASHAIVRINVEDINDSEPKWRGPMPLRITHAINENTPFVYRFTEPELYDEDTVFGPTDDTENDRCTSKFHFEIVQGDETIFRIDKITGTLTTLDTSSITNIENVHLLNVSISDGVFVLYLPVIVEFSTLSKQLSSTLRFQQIVYTTVISETRASTNKSAIVTVKAVGGKAPLRYAIAGDNSIPNSTVWPIIVEPNSGRVLLRERVDRERVGSLISVPLMVNDMTGRRAFARVDIHVNDDNDNAPKWIVPHGGYFTCVDVTNSISIGEHIATVMAIDLDTDDRLEYSLPSADFSADNAYRFIDVHPTSGHVSLRPLNDSTILHRRITVAIRVSDAGNPPHQSEIPLHIRFVRADENAAALPHFTQPRFFFVVSENAPIGQSIGTVTINSLSSAVSYIIVSTNSSFLPFTVNRRNGEITLSKSLNVLLHASYNFIVAAITSKNNKDDVFAVENDDYSNLWKNDDIFYSYTMINISIIDVNDNPPVFNTIYEKIEVPEDVSPSTVIAVFSARDADRYASNAHLLYSIENANPSESIDESFNIDAENGLLMVGTNGLDREQRDSYRLRVIVSDEGNLQTSQNLLVRVLDVNDSPPKFDKNEYFEDISLPDYLQNDSLSCIKFLPPPNLSTAILHFNITDADKWPSMDRQKVFITECDETASENSKELIDLFSISTNKSALMINDLSSRKLLEYAKLQTELKICLIANDALNNGRTIVHLRFHPTKNALGPKVRQLFCEAFQNEQLITLTANASKNQIIYSFKIPSLMYYKNIDVQLIDPQTNSFQMYNNSLILMENDEFYKKPTYILRARIRPYVETAENNMSCIQTLHISIQNTNRMAPIFVQNVFSVTIPENLNVTSTQGYYVLRAEARDDDLGIFGILRYAIVDTSELSQNFINNKSGAAHDNSLYGIQSDIREISKYFVLNSETGALTLHKALDREIHAKFEIPIRVVDGGGLKAYAKVVVFVEDINDNAPTFKQSIYKLKVLENEPIGHELLIIHAHDSDLHGQVRYSIESDESSVVNASKFVAVDAISGVLRLINTLDFESIRNLSLRIVASDNGRPPLNASAIIEIEVLDVNDNAPRFTKEFYEAEISENAPIGTRVLQILAEDNDSEHFGRVSYTLSSAKTLQSPSNWPENRKNENETIVSSTVASDNFHIDSNGWIVLKHSLDYETIRSLRINVHALDGGTPPLSDDAIVHITVLDENDNAPQFAVCNMTTVVQEGIPPGHALLGVTLTDADSPVNGPPFRLELEGEGASIFAIDPLHNLITTQQISYARHQQFMLTVRVFDAGGLTTSCPLRIFVKPQSKYPPEVQPLFVTLNTLMGEFLGGYIGRVIATDKDASDMLRYSIVDVGSRFFIDAESGSLSASGDLLPGLYRFNVSVTDGKFVVVTAIRVDVTDVDQDALDHSLSVRLRGIDGPRFVRDKLNLFYERVARAIGVSSTSIRILSLQETVDNAETIQHTLENHQTSAPNYNNIQITSPNNSFTRDNNVELDVLFTVMRGELLSTSSRGYYRPSYIKQRVESAVNELYNDAGLEIVRLASEVCRRDLCVKGECRDRLWLDNRQMHVIESGLNIVFVAPTHERTFECICQQGFSGRFCDVPINHCSKELCLQTEMCIPSIENAAGFVCTCSPGLNGERCSQPTCEDASANTCSQRETISLLGSGYFQLMLSNSIDARLELGITFKTVSRDATLIYGAGITDGDFHELSIRNGVLKYRWACGSGVGEARFTESQRVDDGLWHELKVSRRGRQTRLLLDNKHIAEGASPPGSDVINLYRQSTILTFGAKVIGIYESAPVKAADNEVYNVPLSETDVTSELSRRLRHRRHHRHRYANESVAELRFRRDTQDYFGVGLSGSRPYSQRLPSGATRETAAELRTQVQAGMIGCFGRISIDGFDLSKTEQGLRMHNAAVGCDTSSMGPCLSVPCKNTGQCVPNRTHNTYSCICPSRFIGSNCEIDLNACAASPCPNGVACHNLYNDFHCSCPSGFTGKTCQLRGDWDPCVTKPCSPQGTCIRHGASFTCQCKHGFRGQFCTDVAPTINWSGALLLRSIEFYIIVILLAITIFLSVLVACIFRRTKSARHLSSDDSATLRESRKAYKRNKDKRKTSKKEAAKSLGSGATSLLSNHHRKSEDDDGGALLVPVRQTTAPCHGVIERPPPPLPPKLSRSAQLYQNLNGSTSANTGFTHAQHHINGLPTVEVRPMQSVCGSTRAAATSCHSPLLIKPNNADDIGNNNTTNSIKSGKTCISTDGNSAPKPPPHTQHCHHHQQGQLQQSTNEVPPPLPIHQRYHANQNQQQPQHRQCANHSQSHLHHYPHTQNENSCIHHHHNFVQRNSNNSNIGSSREQIALQFQGSCHPDARASQRFSADNKAVPLQLYDQVNESNKINDLPLAALSRNGSTSEKIARSSRVSNGALKSNGDYLTMKPIHRAKPFFNANAPSLSQLSDIENDSADDDHNDDSDNSENPPIPPAHRSDPPFIDSSSAHNDNISNTDS